MATPWLSACSYEDGCLLLLQDDSTLGLQRYLGLSVLAHLKCAQLGVGPTLAFLQFGVHIVVDRLACQHGAG